MAFLNNVSFRPSCIVSALPKRFRVALEKELADSVAISTCQVDDLENAVKVRGASIAIVGASTESLDIAERLSHDATQSVKVYLVHYQDSLSGRAPTNGFAGVFDLRNEPGRLAQSIRQEALQPGRHLHRNDLKKSVQRRLLQHFITMSERLSTPQVLMELMLDGFLEIAGAHAGMLLVPSETRVAQFKVLASRGEDAPPVHEHVMLAEDVAMEMSTGATLFLPEGISYSTDSCWSTSFGFSIAVPLMIDNKLLGCLLAKTNEASDDLTDYGAGAAHLLSQLRQRELVTQRERLISQARQCVSPGWLLVSDEGRVVYREGERAQLICNSPEITGARLRHALSEAQSGLSGSIAYRDSLISYRPFHLNDRSYTLLSLKEKNLRIEVAPVREIKITDDLASFIQLQLGDSPQKDEFVKTLVQNQRADMKDRKKIDLEALSVFGIRLTAGRDEIPGEMTGGIALLLMALAKVIASPVSFAFACHDNNWGITFEREENSLGEGEATEMASLTEHPLIKLALQMSGFQKARWSFATYGGRIECKAL